MVRTPEGDLTAGKVPSPPPLCLDREKWAGGGEGTRSLSLSLAEREGTSRRYYTTNSHPQPSSSDLPPQPILTLDLNDRACIKSYVSILKGKGGIYSLVNTVNGKQYIGSAKDFFIRLNEHLKYKNNSNAALQKAFVK